MRVVVGARSALVGPGLCTAGSCRRDFRIDDLTEFAASVAEFICALQRCETAGGRSSLGSAVSIDLVQSTSAPTTVTRPDRGMPSDIVLALTAAAGSGSASVDVRRAQILAMAVILRGMIVMSILSRSRARSTAPGAVEPSMYSARIRLVHIPSRSRETVASPITRTCLFGLSPSARTAASTSMTSPTRGFRIIRSRCGRPA